MWVVKLALISCILYTELPRQAVTGHCFARNHAQQAEPCPKYLNERERQKRRKGYFPGGTISDLPRDVRESCVRRKK